MVYVYADGACVGRKEWYFYSQKDKKYATGLRTNRATVSGYWKATGKDRSITRNGTLVGMRKTLVFYQGRAPKGRKTEWVMHEFRLEGNLWSVPKTDIKVIQFFPYPTNLKCITRRGGPRTKQSPNAPKNTIRFEIVVSE